MPPHSADQLDGRPEAKGTSTGHDLNGRMLCTSLTFLLLFFTLNVDDTLTRLTKVGKRFNS